MKTIIKTIILLLVLSFSTSFVPPKAAAQAVSVSFQMFYSNLSPYGRWVNYQNYGRCWIPNVEAGFRPYFTKGHWVYADIGWTWVSGYPWGWAPFHYGRWVLDPVYGWLWVPGYDWGPAWVSWCRAEGYYGWAPLAPGVSINIALGAGYVIPHDRWIFVQERYIASPNFHRYYVNPASNEAIFRHSTMIRNTYVDNRSHAAFFAGPNRTDVERVSGNRISPAAIHYNRTPGKEISKGNVWLYRPEMQENRLTGTVERNNNQGRIANPGNNNKNKIRGNQQVHHRENHSANRRWR